jgi:hypothetical protein
VNDGSEPYFTTYWDGAEAASGFAFLSRNPGTLQLLVPLLERFLSDMTTCGLPDQSCLRSEEIRAVMGNGPDRTCRVRV